MTKSKQIANISGIIASLYLGASALADIPRIYPTPQEVKLQDSYAQVKGVEIILCKKGQPIAKGEIELPPVEGAYAIDIQGGKLKVYAYDQTGVYYAKQTLIQLLKDYKQALYAQKDPLADKGIAEIVKLGKLPQGRIIDWPDVPYRGTIEGYYGLPWGFEGRKSQIEFYGRNKMNTYIWAPKDDPYHHGFDSRKPYPAKEAEEIRKLTEIAKKNHVKFVWMIHPANTVDWKKDDGKPDMDLLVKKLENMYALGVRHFAVSVDDSSGEINQAKYQAKLTTYLTDHFVKKHPDVGPFIMCPTGYCRGFVGPDWLKELGDNLPADVSVMWTGNGVVCGIDQEGQEWVKQALGRPTFIWWNWPCTDFCRDRLAMGRIEGLAQSPAMKTLYAGFVANPMQWSEASKLGVFSVGDYSWNIEDFNSMQSWKDGIKRLFPSSAAAMQNFSNHNSRLAAYEYSKNLEESAEIEDFVLALKSDLREGKNQSPAITRLHEEYKNAIGHSQQLLSDPSLESLRKEIDEWFTLYGHIGRVGDKAASILQGSNFDEEQFQQLMELTAQTKVLRESGKRPIVGDLHFAPTAELLSKAATTRIYDSLATTPELSNSHKSKAKTSMRFISSSGNPNQNSEAIFDDKIYTLWDNTSQKVGDWYGLDLGSEQEIKRIELLMAGPRGEDYIAKGQMEYSQDAQTWTKLHEEQEGATVQLDLSKEPVKARYVRYRIIEPRAQYWLAICEFSVNKESVLRQYAQSTLPEWSKMQVTRNNHSVGINRVMEVSQMKPGDSLSLHLRQAAPISGLEINLENPTLAQWAQVELLLEDGSKLIIPCKQEGNKITASADSLPKQGVNAMVLTNKSQGNHEVKITTFQFNCPAENPLSYEQNLSDGDLFTAWDAAALKSKDITIPEGATEAVIIGKDLSALSIKGGKSELSPKKSFMLIKLDKGASTLSLTPKDASKPILVYEIIFRSVD